MAQQAPPSQIATPDEKVEAFLARVFGREDPNIPQAPTALSEQRIRSMLEQNMLYECKPEDLVPSAASSSLFAAKDDAGNPVRVLLANAYDIKGDQPQAVLLKTSEGNPFLLINGDYHNWTEAFAQAAIERESRRMRQEIYSGALRPFSDLAEADRSPLQQNYDTLVQYVDKMSVSLHVGKPEIHMDRTGSFSGEMASAFTDSAGINHFSFNEEALKEKLSTAEGMANIEAVVRHEFYHLAKGDLTVAGQVRAHNNPQARRYAEVSADMGSGLSDPKPLESDYEAVLMKLVPAYNAKHPGAEVIPDATGHSLADADYQKISDWRFDLHKDFIHPPLWDRIVALRYEEARLKEMPEPAKDAPDAREASMTALDLVAGKVMQDMQGKWKLPVADVPSSTSPSAPAASPGKVTDIIHKERR